MAYHAILITKCIHSKKNVPKTKMNLFKCVIDVLPNWSHKLSNWYITYPRSRLNRYCSLALATSAPDALTIILIFFTNNKNSSGLLLTNKDILNSYIYNCFDSGYLHNLILQKNFPNSNHYYFWLMESGVDTNGFILHQYKKSSYEKHCLL